MNEREAIFKSISTSPMTPSKPPSIETISIDIPIEYSELSVSSESSSFSNEE